MSKLNFIGKLLDGINVEWKTTSEIFHLRNGYTPSKSEKEYWEDGIIPWFRMEDIRLNGKILNNSLQKVSKSAVKSGKLFPANSIIMATSATIGEHALVTVPYLSNQRFTNLSLKESYIEIFDTKFLYYYCFLLADWCKKNTTTSSFASVDMNGFRNFKFPILCPDNPEKSLAIQADIVSILDRLTVYTAELIKELTAELTACKKQFSYYRDRLFTFDEKEIEWKAMNGVGELVRGNGLFKTDFTEYGVPAIHYGQIYTYYDTFTTKTKSFVSVETARKLKKVDTGDVVITNTSENLDDVGKAVVYLGKEQAVTGGHATIFKPSNQISGKYFAYFTQTHMFASQKRKYAKGTKVIDVSATDMSKIKIPIPSLAEQERIVSILEKFDALTFSLTEELSHEIELRKKQYEFYRNMLLDFSKSEIGV